MLDDGYWNAQQSGLDPIYGLVEIKIPNAGATEANGNRDHDYLYLESQLYFDVIQQDSDLVEGLQDVIDGDTTLSAFASALDTATQGFEQVSGSISDASNDITSPFPGFFTIDEIPHMIHFDNVNYFGYDDFASPTQLNSEISSQLLVKHH